MQSHAAFAENLGSARPRLLIACDRNEENFLVRRPSFLGAVVPSERNPVALSLDWQREGGLEETVLVGPKTCWKASLGRKTLSSILYAISQLVWVLSRVDD